MYNAPIKKTQEILSLDFIKMNIANLTAESTGTYLSFPFLLGKNVNSLY